MKTAKDKLSAFPEKAQIEAGILTDVRYPVTQGNLFESESMTVAEVASINIHGDEEAHIPPRNFIEVCRPDMKKKQKQFVQDFVKTFITEGNTENLVEELGISTANLLRTAIIEMKSPHNAASTIKAKGFDDPLIETGLLRDTIDWKKADD